MKKNTYFSRAFLLALFISLPLSISSCQKKSFVSKTTSIDIDDGRDGMHLILGFSQIGTESSWRTYNSNCITQAAQDAGIQIIMEDAQQKQANQIKAIRSFIVYRVDVIAFVPIVEDGWDNVLREAKEAHIPVIVVDRKIRTQNKNLYAGFIGEDSFSEGEKAAEFLLQKYADSKSSLNILEVSGTKKSSVAKERAAGFRRIISTDKKFSIIKSEDGDFLRSRGKEIIEDIILSNGSLSINEKNIDIIFSHNDGMTLGILEALEKNSIAPGKDVTIVSIDGEQAAIDALKKGKLSCVVECNPNTGKDLMHLVKTVANKNTIPRETYVQEGIFTENDNLTQLAPRGY